MFDSTSQIPYGYCHCGCGQKTQIAQQAQSSKGWVRGEPKRFVSGHYARTKPVLPLADRFWSKVAITANPYKCWEWQAGIKQGYGQFTVKKSGFNQTFLSHRVAYHLTYGEIPNGLEVCHSCDNPACCNPSHLFLGTQQQNIDDMKSKGRGATGEKHGSHKLTIEQVNLIREKYETGDVTQRKLANEFGVNQQQISRIVRGINWAT